MYSVWSISLLDAQPSPTGAHFYTWCLAFVLEIIRISLYATLLSKTNSLDDWTAGELAINIVRIVCLTLLVGSYLIFAFTQKSSSAVSSVEERSSLLSQGGVNGHANGRAYGTARSSSDAGRDSNRTRSPAHSQHHLEDHEEVETDQPGWTRPDKLPSRGWWEYLKGYSVFFPYLWPTGNRGLQGIVVICFLLVLIQRGVNVLVPYQIGVITDVLSGEYGPIHIPWVGILLYILFRFLQGSNSIIGVLRAYLWIPVSQYAYRELSVASFEHVHNLSLDFHIGKKTGEVISALGKGNAINNFLDQITFQVVPMIIDLVVAIGYFLIAFDAYYALVVSVMTFWYVYVTIRLARWRAHARRRMVNLDRYQDGVK